MVAQGGEILRKESESENESDCEDGGTTRGNTEEEKFRESDCERSEGSGEDVSHFKSMRRFLRLLCRHLLEVKHGEGGIHRHPGD